MDETTLPETRRPESTAEPTTPQRRTDTSQSNFNRMESIREGGEAAGSTSKKISSTGKNSQPLRWSDASTDTDED